MNLSLGICVLYLVLLSSCSNILESSEGNAPPSGPSSTAPQGENADQSSGSDDGIARFGELSLSRSSLNFGTIASGAVVSEDLVLTNVGDGDISSLSISLSSPTGHFSLPLNDCAAVQRLGPRATCTITISFQPTTGAASGALNISYGNGSETRTVSLPLAGERASGGTLSVSVAPTSLNFGSVSLGGAPSQTVTISNLGTVTVDLSIPALASPYSRSHNCPSILVGGASCTVNITFSSMSVGTKTATLVISIPLGTGGATMSYTVSMTGTGVN